jgi:hypothetical protein
MWTAPDLKNDIVQDIRCVQDIRRATPRGWWLREGFGVNVLAYLPVTM